MAALRRLLADGADPNQSKDGSPALTLAIRGGHVDSALLLLASGADPNGRDVLQWTPIMWAVSLGSVELVEALIAAGADLQVRDTMNRSLVQMAGGSKRLKKLLVQAGAPQ